MPSQPSPKQRWAPAFVLLLLGFVWGSSFILMKWGLFATDGSQLFPPVELAALRIAIAGFTLLPISLRHWKSLKKEEWLWVSLIGTVGSFIPAILFATAQTALPSAMAGMLNALSPIWTLLIGMAAFGIAVQRNQLGGIAIGFAGTIWLIQAQQSASILSSEPNPSIFIPSLLLVIATVCYGISVNITREKLRGLKSPVIAACSLGLVAMPASLIFITGDIPHLIASHPDGPRGLAAVSVLAAFGTAGALVLFNQLIAWTSAVTAASVTYIIPLFAALWGWWDGEQLNAQHLAAGGCILLGVWLTNRKAKR
jgi:drug/metabolite transporter (DMT)-like permease